MNKKIITIILGVLFVIFLILGILGFVNKGNDSGKGGNGTNPSKIDYKTLELTNETIEFEGMSSSLDGYEFTKQNLSMENGDASATIDNGKILVSLYKGTEEEVKTTLDAVAKPKAVQVALSDSNRVFLYVLDEKNVVYRFVYSVSETGFSDPVAGKYNIPNATSIMIFNSPLVGEFVMPYIVVKTTEGKYVTDTLTSPEETVKLRTFVEPTSTDDAPTGESPEPDALNQTNDEVPTNELTEAPETTEEVTTTEETTEVTE